MFLHELNKHFGETNNKVECFNTQSTCTTEDFCKIYVQIFSQRQSETEKTSYIHKHTERGEVSPEDFCLKLCF